MSSSRKVKITHELLSLKLPRVWKCGVKNHSGIRGQRVSGAESFSELNCHRQDELCLHFRLESFADNEDKKKSNKAKIDGYLFLALVLLNIKNERIVLNL